MKSTAMALVADRTFDVIQVEIPLIGADEALLRVEANGLCGTDIEQYHGLLARKNIVQYPHIPGHEPVGVLEEIGSEIAARTGLKTGDRVAIAGPMNCGRCFHCLGGAHHLCRSMFPDQSFIPAYGHMPLNYRGGLWGGYSQYMHLLPGTLLCKIPENIPPQFATLYQPLAAGLRWAVDVPGTGVGDSALVLGCGQRGLGSVVALRRAGARTIIVTGLAVDGHKLALARQLGATHTIVVDEESVRDKVMEITNGHGVDVAIDVVPRSSASVLSAIECVRTGGTIVVAGVKEGDTSIDTNTLLQREITLRGVFTQKYEHYLEAVHLLAEDFERLAPLHTHEFVMQDVERALAILSGEVAGEAAISISICPNPA